MRAVQGVEVVKARAGRVEPSRDVAAVEEPLEIRLHGSPFVVIMRTPGADRELAAGFLLAERVIATGDDLGVIEYCREADDADRGNVVNVTLVAEAAESVAERLADRRLVAANSSCGVCGRRSIDDLLQHVPSVHATVVVSDRIVLSLPDRLRAAQRVFDETGGLHAAALFDCAGQLVQAAEDVGRHNAVDKVIGAQLLLDRLPLAGNILFVSGRTSFEILQKAIVAGIPIVAAVSAPSSLAIDLAREAGVTLIGFVRGDTFNVYTGVERVTLVSD